ncbi:QacE family quaternary ammonium compound efflux SMR transporter [Marinococcus halophilus]|uniref:Multidrug resistance protein SMR n=1 Tax=Marinococcus halophilus TaxID=1371 RepID=A0A510Y2M9_MARHA|nr:multidrug efflux SMR transporter [Marinococcus halophilus]OZT81599.1 QacE family quaternary ammonium compound efflux SMR transporter [Marinococcus halophilus]GEK57544.1 multidrug resistance protein SMR [Marinococcus halophilus]
MGWINVAAAATFEILWVIGLKHASAGWEWAGTLVAIVLSFLFLIRAGEYLPVGTSYVAFVGIGTIGTTVLDMIFFGQPFQWSKMAFIIMLIAGISGLHMASGRPRANEGGEQQ